MILFEEVTWLHNAYEAAGVTLMPLTFVLIIVGIQQAKAARLQALAAENELAAKVMPYIVGDGMDYWEQSDDPAAPLVHVLRIENEGPGIAYLVSYRFESKSSWTDLRDQILPDGLGYAINIDDLPKGEKVIVQYWSRDKKRHEAVIETTHFMTQTMHRHDAIDDLLSQLRDADKPWIIRMLNREQQFFEKLDKQFDSID